jgi:glycyl-tRNA synthetase
MRFHPALAPFKAAVLPLTKKQAEAAAGLHAELSKYFMCDYDVAGNIGRRYRREDEIGTPYCITVDFDTAEDGAVTIRDRDTMEQIRVPIGEVRSYIEAKLEF